MQGAATNMPAKESPRRTVGPSCRASTRSAEATAAGSVVSGFCTAVALSPAACNRAITSDQLDPSANSPCTRTTFRAFGADCAAAALAWKRVLAAPAATMFTNVRRFIGYLGRRSACLFMEVLLCVKLSWLLGGFQFERGGADSDGSGAGTQERPAIELEHFFSPLRLPSVTLKPSKLN